ncbi:MAG: hypothetical protein HY941_07150 [Gammaproteobacteria bacterium]|nr:hypothetical protein [Gammaproteobacteria bacterium]
MNDGLVLASDSATTLRLSNGDAQVYNNADKIFNLYKGLPIGAATWGLGSIGRSSMATLAKDFRRQVTNGSSHEPNSVAGPWGIHTEGYTVEEIASKFHDYLSERLTPQLDNLAQINAEREAERNTRGIGPNDDEALKPIVLPGFWYRIAGYDAKGDDPHVFEVVFDGDKAQLLAPVSRAEPIHWGGQGEPVQRIVLGLGDSIVGGLGSVLGLGADDSVELARELLPYTDSQLVHPAMPIMDAIDLAEFLVDTAIKYYRFVPGAQIVGGAIETATITRHEGFRWIKRKHFFNTSLNPHV